MDLSGTAGDSVGTKRQEDPSLYTMRLGADGTVDMITAQAPYVRGYLLKDGRDEVLPTRWARSSAGPAAATSRARPGRERLYPCQRRHEAGGGAMSGDDLSFDKGVTL